MSVLEHDTSLGEGAIEGIADVLERYGANRIAFVVDTPAYEAGGAADAIEPALEASEVVRFSGFAPNPNLADIESGTKLFRDLDADLVLAFGGGTAIDIGKVIAAVGRETAPIRDLITGDALLSGRNVPLVAIPTTAGTGSEATSFAVAYVDGEKYSLDDPSLLPNHSIVDPRLTHSLPARITAATGLDAFCQAIESIWAVGATEESIGYATEAAQLAYENLPAAVNTPTPATRHAMSRASHLAGRAINITRTTASHALSYPLTSQLGIPHGIAVALTLGPMLEYNSGITDSDCVDPRGAAHVVDRMQAIFTILDCCSAAEAKTRVTDLIGSLGCPSTLVEAGITDPAELSRLIAGVNALRMSNNPRRTTHEALIELLGR
ncbi:phosphonoacetaldehyde reductase [Allorhodopirellula solitaria]|uniref:Phosphonoacetaldehyde reductase n=1 Tax=Allorhodopirellula solitaria TaxID=2527987 RepID=A0A5C5WM34_9BACT|nr:phosphonoacetaldehyde reductase [Allorhodopirellula solitaria]TWT51670.1 Phosphonoacetaldehyde reductase [Allorhodopirellula solitaria]